MSIASEITRLQNAKASIKTSIENKGVTVPSNTKLDGYSTLVDSIVTTPDLCIKSVTAGNELRPDAGYTNLIAAGVDLVNLTRIGYSPATITFHYSEDATTHKVLYQLGGGTSSSGRVTAVWGK